MANRTVMMKDEHGDPIKIKAIDQLDGTFALAVDAKIEVENIEIGKVDPLTSTPTMYNVSITVANTEYSQALPANCRGFMFQCRSEVEIRYAFVTGKVAGAAAPYGTLKAGDIFPSPAISQEATPSTLYLASATAGLVVEVIAWS